MLSSSLEVHEKGVLFPSLAVCLLPATLTKEWRPWSSSAWILALHFQLVSLFSMHLGARVLNGDATRQTHRGKKNLADGSIYGNQKSENQTESGKKGLQKTKE